MRESVYIVIPESAERKRIVVTLASEPVTVEVYDCAEQFLTQVAAMASGCVLAPSDLPGMGVRALIIEIHRRQLPLAIVVIGHDAELVTAVELVRVGAADFLEHPFSNHQLRSVVRRAVGTDGRTSARNY
jgi:two-component system response regulator FixJ